MNDSLILVKEHSIAAQKSWGDLYYHVMPKVINDNNCLIGAEIGVAFGGHAESILLKTKVKKIYCIDSYKIYKGSTDSFFLLNGAPYTQSEYDALYEVAKERLGKFNDRQTIIREEGSVAYNIIKEELDFVFIDAQHTYTAVLNDISMWYDKVKVGGIISGHDYEHSSFPGVTDAVNEFLNKKGLKIEVGDGHVWWAQKK